MSLAIIRNQAKLVGIALVAGLVLAFSPAANAASDRAECEGAGGTFEKEQGVATCTFTTVPGNNRGGVTKTEEQSQKGSFKSAHPTEEENCVNNRGGSHCK